MPSPAVPQRATGGGSPFLKVLKWAGICTAAVVVAVPLLIVFCLMSISALGGAASSEYDAIQAEKNAEPAQNAQVAASEAGPGSLKTVGETTSPVATIPTAKTVDRTLVGSIAESTTEAADQSAIESEDANQDEPGDESVTESSAAAPMPAELSVPADHPMAAVDQDGTASLESDLTPEQQELVEAANLAYWQDRYEDAIAAYEQIEQTIGLNPLETAQLSYSHFVLDQLDEAAERAEEVLENEESDNEARGTAYFTLASAMFDAEEAEVTIDLSTLAIDALDDDHWAAPLAHWFRGHSYEMSDRSEEALPDMLKVTEGSEENSYLWVEGHLAAGRIYGLRGDAERAIRHTSIVLDRVGELAADIDEQSLAVAYQYRGMMRLILGQKDEADADLQEYERRSAEPVVEADSNERDWSL